MFILYKAPLPNKFLWCLIVQQRNTFSNGVLQQKEVKTQTVCFRGIEWENELAGKGCARKCIDVLFSATVKRDCVLIPTPET